MSLHWNLRSPDIQTHAMSPNPCSSLKSQVLSPAIFLSVRTGHETTDWFQIGKGLHQGCILSPCLFNIYAEYIMSTSFAALNMSANLENSAVDTGLEKVSFHSSPKEGQCQRMFKLSNNCTYLTCYQNDAQNSPSQASAIREPWTSRCSSWI